MSYCGLELRRQIAFQTDLSAGDFLIAIVVVTISRRLYRWQLNDAAMIMIRDFVLISGMKRCTSAENVSQ